MKHAARTFVRSKLWLALILWMWQETTVPIFIERFLLPLFAALVLILAISNPMGFDRTQRITGTIAVIAAAYFLAHTLYRWNRPSAANDDLQERTVSLSNEILRFLTERNTGQPNLPRTKENWDASVQSGINYSMKTMDIYSERFAGRVIATHDELLRRGIRDKELELYYQHPTNPLGVRAVGERLGAVAETMKNH